MRAQNSINEPSYPAAMPESFRQSIFRFDRGKAKLAIEKLKRYSQLDEHLLWLKLWESALISKSQHKAWQTPTGITSTTLGRRPEKIREFARELHDLKQKIRLSCAELGFEFAENISPDSVEWLNREATHIDILLRAGSYYGNAAKQGLENSQRELIALIAKQTGRPHYKEALVLLRAAYSAAGMETDITADALRMRCGRRSKK